MENAYRYYKNALTGVRLPAAYVDWNLLRKNADLVHQRVRSLPIRLASKSLRSSWIMKTIMAEQKNIVGILAYSAREAAFLCEQGFDDIVVAYPTVEKSDIEGIIPHLQRGRTLCLMVDHNEHITLLNTIGRIHNVVIPLALDTDLSIDFPLLYFGVRRSPLKSLHDLALLVALIKRSPFVKLIGLMGYEAQMSVADRVDPRPMVGGSIRMLKRTAIPLIALGRQMAVRYLHQQGFHLRFVNGGGTATLESTVLDKSLTEVTVGSAYFGPHSFDHFSSFSLYKAAGFALPITRIPAPNFVTCHGGGYSASGPHHASRLPQPYLPTGLSLLKYEGAGEVQTPLKFSKPHKLAIGDPIFFRHAKAGELAEHFNYFHIIVDGFYQNAATTYRGEGHDFL